MMPSLMLHTGRQFFDALGLVQTEAVETVGVHRFVPVVVKAFVNVGQHLYARVRIKVAPFKAKPMRGFSSVSCR